MKFTLSTKPLKTVMGLGIIKANITKFYYRSNLVQLTATRDTLKVNIEATGIKTRMVLKGSGDTDTSASIIVDCSKFKNLIDSIENDVVTLEFIDNGLYVHAGTSKFAIPQVLDVNDVQLTEPIDQYSTTGAVVIKPAEWQFVKDHQLYALSESETRPVYKNVWVSDKKDIITGDMDRGLFVYSKACDFGSTCLLPASLVNLFTTIPESAVISKADRDYVLTIEADSYTMITQFTPRYEDDESVGSYHAEIVLDKFKHPDEFITLDIVPVVKFINQNAILANSDKDKVLNFTVDNKTLTLSTVSNSYSMPVEATKNYTVNFDIDYIKSVLANFDTDRINLAPMSRAIEDDNGKPVEQVYGFIFWSDTLTTVLAGKGM